MEIIMDIIKEFWLKILEADPQDLKKYTSLEISDVQYLRLLAFKIGMLENSDKLCEQTLGPVATKEEQKLYYCPINKKNMCPSFPPPCMSGLPCPVA